MCRANNIYSFEVKKDDSIQKAILIVVDHTDNSRYGFLISYKDLENLKQKYSNYSFVEVK